MAQMNPQLVALLQAMAQNPNADSGGPILGGHPGGQTVNNTGGVPYPGGRGEGPVPGGDGPSPDLGGPFVGERGGDGNAWGPNGRIDDPIGGRPTGDEFDNGDDGSQNHTSLLGPHGTNLPGLLAGMNALVSPGHYNARHPLTLMRQTHPGHISQPTKSGESFGHVDQASTNRAIIAQRQQQMAAL